MYPKQHFLHLSCEKKGSGGAAVCKDVFDTMGEFEGPPTIHHHPPFAVHHPINSLAFPYLSTIVAPSTSRRHQPPPPAAAAVTTLDTTTTAAAVTTTTTTTCPTSQSSSRRLALSARPRRTQRTRRCPFLIRW